MIRETLFWIGIGLLFGYGLGVPLGLYLWQTIERDDPWWLPRRLWWLFRRAK